MGSIEERIYAAVDDYRTVWPEPWPLSPNLMLMVEAVETLERVEDQIHADGGYIDQIVGLEESNAELQGKIADIRAVLTDKREDDVSCSGYTVLSDGCFAGKLANRILEVLRA